MIAMTDKEFQQLSQYIHDQYGIKLGQEKKVLIAGRLHKLLEQKKLTSYSECYRYILEDQTGNAEIVLANLVTTNHTFFMRENEHFSFFRSTVLPLLRRSIKDYDLRIWSAGCSSGEEPYTLAMLIDEFFGEEKKIWDCKLLATDISSKMLEVAVKGIYSHEALLPLTKFQRNQYFKQITADTGAVVEAIKREVIFRIFNLTTKVFPFKKRFHIIFCRNVMIYFDERTKQELIDKFYNALEPGGYLFIGHSESIAREYSRFKYVMPAVYRKEL